ncbi:MAG: glycosyltransferase, partial [Alphaproteobacteria bacterium]|nr:glycosyltransferase [Alphaproteobacteria bacterium]
TRDLVDAYAGPGDAIYRRNEAGYGHMTLSRNIGLFEATGQVIAFVDDDSFARPAWAEQLLQTYQRHADIGGAGGRAVGDERQLDDPVDPNQTKIGVMRRDGMIGGVWSADCDRELDVEHFIGCNMSFRRSVLAELGGLRDEYPGPEVREETDLCFRVRRLGYRLVYNPKAVVVHIGAPKPQGARFDFRYEFYTRRNHTYLLLRNHGFGAFIWRYLLSSLAMDVRLHAAQAWRSRLRQLPTAVAGLAVTQWGKAVGFARGGWVRLGHGLNPVRRDAVGRDLRQRLCSSASSVLASRARPDAAPAAAASAEPANSVT